MTAAAPVVAAPGTVVPRPFQVLEVRRETPDTFTLAIEPADGKPRPPFEPGQFDMVYAFGVGEVPISMSSDPAVPLVLHTIRDVGAVTHALCRCEPGDVVGVRGPFGSTWGMDTLGGRDVVVVAGGIGLAPLRPAIHHLLAHRDEVNRVVLLVGARTPSDLCFGDQLDEWRAGGIDVEVTVDYAEAGWTGTVGLVTTLLPKAPFRPADTVALVCGPEGMMKGVAKGLLARGVAAERIRVSLERNMKCAVAQCGHCQLGPAFVCHDGPVLPWSTVGPLLEVAER
jgi:NAD(P)H-flavin reductase